jgi:hypothetical protein
MVNKNKIFEREELIMNTNNIDYHLNRAKQKLNRLEKENENVDNGIFNSVIRRQGQPFHNNETAVIKRMNQLQSKGIRLIEEIELQKKRIKILEFKKGFAEKGLIVDGNGGLIKCIDNINGWEERVKNLEAALKYNKANKLPLQNPYNGVSYTSKKLKDAKYTLECLYESKKISECVLPPKIQELIDNKVIKQWAKKPHIFFIQGLYKIALEYDPETMKLTTPQDVRYRAITNEAKQKVKEIMNYLEEELENEYEEEYNL